jgi:transcriptional regulator with XRE-family HTH domain
MATAFSPLGRMLREARLGKNLSQLELAKQLGMTQTTISHAESGRDLKFGTLVEIARALDLEPLLAPRAFVPAINALIRGGPGQRNALIHAADDDRPYRESLD